MEEKGFYEKTEEFAKKIINLAAEEGLTVRELCKAADMSKIIAEYSVVDKNSTEKPDYTSQHIAIPVTCGGKKLFEIERRTGSPCFNC